MNEKKQIQPKCASCELEIPQRACFDKNGKGGKHCPSLTGKSQLALANDEYKEDIKEFARQASLQEASCYANRDQSPYIMQPTKTRIIEICEFADRMDYRKLGLAFCLGLSKEARVVDDIFKQHGFDVLSICCKAGKTSKKHLDIDDSDTIYKGTDESMCNPIFQARMLSSENADLVVLLGLCVGHDTLFFKYCDAPVTVLAVKDRVTGHNPLAAIYTTDSNYKKIKSPDLNE